MDLLTYLLLSLLELWADPPPPTPDSLSERPTLALHDIDTLFHHLVATLAPSQLVRYTQARDAYIAEHTPNSPPDRPIERAIALLGIAESAVRANDLEQAALGRMEQIINSLRLIKAASTVSNFNSTTLTIEHIDIFDYIRELRFHEKHEQTALIGFFDDATLKVDHFSQPPIVRRIGLTYQQNDSAVILDFRQLETQLSQEPAKLIPQRKQRATASNDILVYPRERTIRFPQLRIETREHTTLTLELGQLHLIIPPFEGMKLIVTSFIDCTNTNINSRYIRTYQR